MLGELTEMRQLIQLLRDMEPERALRWLKEEELCNGFMRHIDRLEEAVRSAVKPQEQEEVEHLELQLGPRYSVEDDIGRSDAKQLAGFIRSLPLKEGYVVSLGTWTRGESNIVVHHATMVQCVPYEVVEKMFPDGATGPGSKLYARLD